MPPTPAPYDYSGFVTSIAVTVGNFGIALIAVAGGALLITAIVWGAPLLLRLFLRVSADAPSREWLDAEEFAESISTKHPDDKW